jgi:hypothetical protein
MLQLRQKQKPGLVLSASGQNTCLLQASFDSTLGLLHFRSQAEGVAPIRDFVGFKREQRERMVEPQNGSCNGLNIK